LSAVAQDPIAAAGAIPLARARWLCRRGMRELDALLLQYLDCRYATADAWERHAFVRLLELPDPDLYGYLVGRTEVPDDSLRNLVTRIRDRAY
jgi:antitoxin CptB